MALAVVVVVVTCGACSGSVDPSRITGAGGPVVGVSVAGRPGSEPAVRIAAPLAVPSTASRVVVAGTGDPVQVDQVAVLEVTVYNARTGTKALSTYDPPRAPIVAKNSDDRLFPVLAAALVGLRQGSRLTMAVAAADAYGAGGDPPAGVRRDDAVVVVVDVLAVPPTTVLDGVTGDPRAVPAGSPRVVLDAGEPSRIDVSGATEPSTVVAVPLVRGDGPPVRAHSLVTLDLLAQAWGTDVPFESTYFKEPVVLPVGTEGSVPAWDEALVGLPRGTRVLVIAPAAQARVPLSTGLPSRATIAWVIDILGVS